jgi:hypothetical protein
VLIGEDSMGGGNYFKVYDLKSLRIEELETEENREDVQEILGILPVFLAN